ncbi:hypothetical protein SK128_006210 [Halocaridina rubra]|uniref:C-type lectin domain-containing protein n=1 Tax=Halocaridina rubra TaxID=373956 RepID=A0AAN8ZWJ6_HALRR
MKANFAHLVLAMMLSLSHSGEANGFCVSPYVMIAGKCYNFHQDMQTWGRAEMVCAREGGALASVLTNDQYNGLLSHINANYAGTYWTSGASRGGRWIWVANGNPMATQWWGANRVPPANAGNCAYFCSFTLRYWSKSCTNSLRFICEKDAMVIQEPDNEQEEPEFEFPIPQ